MVNPTLENDIQRFISQHGQALQALIDNLDEARISHYSSGCGNKHVTFDIFPASAYVIELANMISLNRSYKAKAQWGFRDASTKNNYNPATDFIQYLRRWSHFAEQVMKTEGDAARGVAAARAKLIMANLMTLLNRENIANKAHLKVKSTDFARLMRDIGVELETRETSGESKTKTDTQKNGQRNYLKALAAIEGDEILAQLQAA